MDLLGIAAIITAISTPIVVVYVALLNMKANKLDKQVTHIDHAVNGKAPGAQSMVSQVADIHEVVLQEGGSGL